MRLAARLLTRAAVPALLLSLILYPVVDNISAAYRPATGWDYEGTINLDDEYVIDATVLKEASGDYKMWYTMLDSDLNETILGGILDNFDTDPETAITDLMNSTRSVIGYAYSDDNLISWDDTGQVFPTATDGSMLDSIGSPAVVLNETTSELEMWYTRLDSDLTTVAEWATVLGDIAFDVDDLYGLIDGTADVIGYATSNNGGTTWSVQNDNVLSGGPAIWESVTAPTVVENDGVYEMSLIPT